MTEQAGARFTVLSTDRGHAVVDNDDHRVLDVFDSTDERGAAKAASIVERLNRQALTLEGSK